MPRFVERHFELVAITIVALCWVAVFYAGHRVDHDVTILDILRNNRAPVYGALASLFGLIFGFGMTAISIILAFAQSPKLLILRSSRHWRTLWSIFTRGIWVLIGVAVTAVLALIFDKDSSPRMPVTYMMIFAVFLGMARLCLVLWAFQKLVFIMTQPDSKRVAWESDLETLEDTARVR